jgi:biotin transport system ATP-binding protein
MVIWVEDLACAWPGEARTALAGVSFSAERGELVCLAGCNGSGKSTLLQTLAGILAPASGVLRISAEGADRASALLLQDADMQIVGSTVAEDMLLAWIRPDEERIGEARALAARLGLLECWDAPVHTLSYGQKRKLCLAAALLAQPACLLLDEPFSGLDYPGLCELRGILKANQAAGMAQVVSTHDLEPLLDISTRVLVLHGGGQVFCGEPARALAELATRPEWGLRLPCSVRYSQSIAP